MLSNYNFTYKEVSFEELSLEEKTCVEASMLATNNSYAPYSEFKVGVAALMQNGALITASNQENVSFSAGVCAERALVYSDEFVRNGIAEIIAISALKKGKFVDVSPCGVCRQSLLEVEIKQQEKIVLIFKRNSNFVIINGVDTLLPLSFDRF